MADVTAGKVVVRLEGQDVGLTSLLQQLQQNMSVAQRETAQLGQAFTTLTGSQRGTESAILRQSSAYAASRIASGDYNSALVSLGSTLQKLTPGTDIFYRAQTKLQTALTQSAKTAEETAQRINNAEKTKAVAHEGGLESLAKLTGAYFAFKEVAGVVGEAINAGNELEKTEAVTRALSGSQERYNEVMALAASQQKKYGGTLQENVEALGGFVNISNRTGVSLVSIENIARRLAIIDPAQGFKGASIALKEFFSGDINSLKRMRGLYQ